MPEGNVIEEHFYPTDWGSEQAAKQAASDRFEMLRTERGESIEYEHWWDSHPEAMGIKTSATLEVLGSVDGTRAPDLRDAFILRDKGQPSYLAAERRVLRSGVLRVRPRSV